MRRNCTQQLYRRSLAFALAGSLAASVCLMPATAFAASSAEIKQQLAEAQAELGDLEAEVSQAQANLGKTNYELDQTRDQIGTLEDKIDKNEVKLGEARDNLAAIIEQSYKQGGEPSILELVLSSTSFDDLISRIHYANKVSQAKREAIQTVSELQDSLREDKVSLEKQEKEQVKLLKSQEEQQAVAEEALAKQTAYVDGLSEELVVAIEAERAAEAEASRRAAEEAARREREEQAAREKAEKERQRQAEEQAKKEAQEAEQQQQEQQAEQQETEQEQQEAEPEQQEQAEPEQQAEPEREVYEDDTEPTVVNSPASSASSDMRSVAVSAALSQVGKAYGHDNNGSNWDCSGLTSYAWNCAGVPLTASSGHYFYGQFQIVKGSGNWVTSVSALQPGDLVFFSNDGGSTCYHVAMYIGGGSIVHAIDYSHGVQVTDLNFCYGFCGGGSPV